MSDQAVNLPKQLLSLTRKMYRHACDNEWTEVRSIDDRRVSLVRDAIDAGATLGNAELKHQLQEYHEAIMLLAIRERERFSAEYQQSKSQVDQCSYYLKSGTE